MILQIFGPYGKIGIMGMSEAGNEAAEGDGGSGGAPGAAGSLRDPPCWESRRLCPVFPGVGFPCVPTVFPRCFLLVFPMATSGSGQGGEMAWDRCPWENHGSGSPRALG